MLGKNVLWWPRPWTETRGPGVLQGEVIGVTRRKARRLVIGKALDALHQLPEKLEVERVAEKRPFLLEYAGSCKNVREGPF